ncbi:SEP domain, partial [Trinorchestia longiramus]
TALSSYFEETGDDIADAGGGESAVGGTAEGSAAPASGRGSAKPSQGSGALASGEGWSSNSDNSDDEDDEDRRGQAFYAGGSEHSGQQVLGPPRKRNNVVAKLFKAAKDHGADVVEDSSTRVRSVRRTFQGTSYRLGETMDDTQVFSGGSSSSSSTTGQQEAEPVELRMWRTGFTVGDGPLRPYEDEESMRFLKEIKNGRIPLELLKRSGGREVAINLSDHHHEDYTPVKIPRKAFTGQGQTLGSPAPAVVGQVTHVPGPGGSAHKPQEDPKQLEDDAKKTLNVDASKPTTNVQ